MSKTSQKARKSPKQELEEAIKIEEESAEAWGFPPTIVEISYETARRLLNGINRI